MVFVHCTICFNFSKLWCIAFNGSAEKQVMQTPWLTPDICSDRNTLQNNLLCILGLVQVNLFWAHDMLTHFFHHHLVHKTPKLHSYLTSKYRSMYFVQCHTSLHDKTVAEELSKSFRYYYIKADLHLVLTWESHSWWRKVLLTSINWWLAGWMLVAASGFEGLTDVTGISLDTPFVLHMLFYYHVSRPM